MAYLGPVAGVPAILTSLGAKPTEIIEAADLDPRLFDRPENQVSALAVERLLLLCAERTNCAHFGVLVGQRAKLASLGPLGSLMNSCGTLREALQALEQHLRVQTRGGFVHLEVDSGVAVLTYSPYHSVGEGAGLVCEGVLTATAQALRDLCGPAWAPAEVFVPRRVPASQEAYSSAFRAPIRFNQEMAALVIAAESLDHPLPHANAAERRTFEQYVLHNERTAPPDVADEIRRQLFTQLVTARCSSKALAQHFAIHRRTLNRRLRAEGTGFKRIVDEIRSATARQLLADTELSLAHIAAVLDFSEPAAFTRAFRRWSAGVTPSAWRVQHRGA
jgi:AraC-like DNA-binding protein